MIRTARLGLVLPLAFASAAAFAQVPAPHFPPIAELLGEGAELLPARGEGLRDGLADAPSLASDLRGLRRSDPAARAEAARRLGERKERAAIPHLGALLLQSNEDEDARAAAAIALGRIGDWRSAAFLRRSAGDASRKVRFASALALGKVRDPEGLRALEQVSLRDAHWWVRYAAAVALGGTRDPAAVPPLARAAREDLRWQVRQQAARSLGELGGRLAARALGETLNDEDAAIRATAARALGEMGGPDSLDLLHAAWGREKDEFARRIIGAALRAVASR